MSRTTFLATPALLAALICMPPAGAVSAAALAAVAVAVAVASDARRRARVLPA
jgi:hypothetical protein